MKRRLLLTLLALCMAMVLLPVTALADGELIARGYSFSYVVPNYIADNLSDSMFVSQTREYSFTVFPDPTDNGNPGLYLDGYTRCDGRWEGNTYYVTMSANQPYYWRHSAANAKTKYTVIFNGTGDPVSQDELIAFEVTGGNLYFNTAIGAIASADVTVIEADIPAEISGKPVTSIGSRAFEYCDSLTGVTIPDSVTSIGDGAFSRCDALTKVNIPEGVASLGREMFTLCTSLTEVTIPDSVTSIGYETFAFCENLVNVTLPNTITSLDYRAFFGCASLTEVNLPGSLTSIGMESFGSCTSLSSITIPGSVTSIGYDAFAECSNLASVTISNGLTSIISGVFSRCSALTDVAIPASVLDIDHSVFYKCTNLVSIRVDKDNPNYTSDEAGVLFNKDMTELIVCPAGKEGAYVVPASVARLGDYAFSDCAELTRITLPDSVTSLGQYAFSYCAKLTELVLPDSVTSFGDNAFSGCDQLVSINIPKNVTEIPYNAFSYCRSLTSIEISEGVTRIGRDAFISCVQLETITIPATVTEISESAFLYLHQLTHVYYGGSASRWKKIAIGDYNNDLTKEGVTIHYASEDEEDLCMVTFYTLGGTQIAPAIVTKGTPTTKPVDPVRADYIFGGWYTDETYQSKWDFSTPVTEDITLYAKWNDKISSGEISLYAGFTESGGVEYTITSTSDMDAYVVAALYEGSGKLREIEMDQCEPSGILHFTVVPASSDRIKILLVDRTNCTPLCDAVSILPFTG